MQKIVILGMLIFLGFTGLKAQWYLPLKKTGYYEVFFYMYKARRMGRGGDNRDENGEYNFIIHGDEGAQESSLESKNAEAGWNSLGTYNFTSDTALVELTNKSQLRMIFADAVKLVQQ